MAARRAAIFFEKLRVIRRYRYIIFSKIQKIVFFLKTGEYFYVFNRLINI